jgi:hypothetical protein
LEEIGEFLSILWSSKLEALLPQLSSVDMTAVMQPPSRRPSSLLLRKLDVASQPSGLVPRWLGNGRWQKMHAGRKPTSCSLSFLGGDEQEY